MKLHKSVDADQGSSSDKILCRKYCTNGASLYCGCAWEKHVIKHYCCDSKLKFLGGKVTHDPGDALSVGTSFHKLCKGMASLRCGRSCDSPNSSYD